MALPDLLAESSLLLVFVVAAVGVVVGKIRVGGFSLGISAVLFVGLAFSALDARLVLPEFVFMFGLALFVYMVGLASGPGFVAALRREGLRDNLLALAVIGVAFVVAVGVAAALLLDAPLAAGLFAGSTTNTPALAAVVEALRVGANDPDTAAAQPVIAYTLCYPVGVIGVIAVIQIVRRLWRIDFGAEAERLPRGAGAPASIASATVRVTRVDGLSIGELLRGHDWDVRLVRLVRDGTVTAATPHVELRRGDLVSVIGPGEDLERVAARLGETTDEHPELDRTRLDFRRVFVSNTAVAGRRIGELGLERHGALATRVRRGDVDLVAHDDMVLAMGDRVRVVAPRSELPDVARIFGDSYRALGEVDVMTLGLGIALGLLIGVIPVPLGGDAVFRLGFAGGPLIAGIALGAIGRSGPVLWQIPYGANLTLRQLGVVLFLAGIGTRSGQAFAAEVADPRSLLIIAGGAAVTITVAAATMAIGYRVLKIPMGVLIGMLAGIQTQPAVLAFALDETGDDLPNNGYASVFPVAMIAKIVLAQLMLFVVPASW